MPTMARLEVVAGRAIGMWILIDDELLIGRHADGAGRLADDEEISRSHARITLDRSDFCAIEDLGSTNGTFVNGLRIAGPQTLSVGDTIELGGTTLVVRELPIPASERTLTAVPPQPTAVPRGSSPSQETPVVGSGVAGRPQRDAAPPDRPAAELSLSLHIDFTARTATVTIDEGDDPVHLVFDGDAWRPAS